MANVPGKLITSASAAPPAHTHAQSDVTGLVAALSAKQATLVSGTTIKTVNGVSLLGSGDLPIAGGGGASLTQVTLSVSPVAIAYKEIVVADGTVTALSKITADLVPELDAENDIEGLADIGMRIWAIAEAGQVRFVLTASGAFAGPFKVNYGVAA